MGAGATAAGAAGEAVRLRPLEPSDRGALAALIHDSTNAWYLAHGRGPIFTAGPASADLFAEVYEALDPGACVVAEAGGALVGSCFYHPRETHLSLGIMNVHPDHFGRGIARRLLRYVTDLADARGQPVRLVSSALNLDSFSLYTRAGFVPRCAYQDVQVAVPAGGLGHTAPGLERVRPATPGDVEAIAALELEVSGISRRKDYRAFIENAAGIWHLSVLDRPEGGLEGFLASVNHPGSNMLGPGVARSEGGAAALLLAELGAHRGRSPVFLVPVDCAGLVRQVYGWGGRNCELHFAQVRGAFRPFRGVTMPTFMPETG